MPLSDFFPVHDQSLSQAPPAAYPADGGGVTAALIRHLDWAQHPLGLPAAWPAALRTTVQLMLDSRFAMFLAWGPELHFLYNDAYVDILADKHPAAMGGRFQHIWSEVWDDILPLVRSALGGGATWEEDLPLVLNRRGYDEQAWFSFSYSPTRDDSGRVAGLLCTVTETTDRVLASVALRDSEARMEAVANSIDQMVWSTTPEGQHDYYNRRWYEFTGVPEGSTNGEAWEQVFHPDDRTGAWEAWRASLDTGQPYLIEYRLRHHSGAYRWVLGRAQAVRNAAGAIVRWYGTCTDIQTIVEAREVLTRSRTDLEALVSARTAERDRAWLNAPGLLMIAGTDGTIQTVNPGWTTSLGWPPAALLGRSLLDLMHPDDRAAAAAAIVDTAVGARAHVSRLRRIDGSYRWVSWKASRSDCSSIVVGRDVSDEKRRNEALLLLENIVQSHSSAICAFDTDLRVIAFNRAHGDGFFRVFAYHCRIGEVLPNLFPAAQAALLQGHMARALQGESFTVVETFGGSAETRSSWEVSYYPLRDAQDRIIGAFHHANDVSVRVRAQAELEAARDALRQAQKMEAVGQLTGGLAHDFNNLLAGIGGSLQVIQRKLARGQTHDLDRFLSMGQNGVKRAAGLTHRLLAFSRQQTLDPKATDIRQLIGEMEDLIRRTVGPSIELHTAHADDLWLSMLDANQMENAVLNLAINARDAMPSGGRLTVATANRMLDHLAAAERGLDAAAYVVVSVSDTGTGMPPEVIARAFDPFFTTKPIGLGTGLGLSMIHGFAKQSGGSVHIHSAVGQGTTVSLYLPRHEGPAETAAVPSNRIGAGTAASGHRVLVVDDEPSVRAVLVESLAEMGFGTLEAEDGPSALQILQSDVHVDLLVTDVGLPGGLNGRQVAEAARAARPGIRVLFITGYAENAVLNHGHLDVGMLLMTKPFSIDDFIDRVRQIVGPCGAATAGSAPLPTAG